MTMAKLNHIQVSEDDYLFSYYITLCHIYYFNVSEENSEEEKIKAEGTIENITSLIFHAINIDGITIREMDNEQYQKQFKRFYNDLLNAIKECCKNEVSFEEFLVIIDEIIGAAIKLSSAIEKLDNIKVQVIEEDLDSHGE